MQESGMEEGGDTHLLVFGVFHLAINYSDGL